MSVLHSPRAPWYMLILFGVAALSFFVLAAGEDVGLLPEAVTSGEKGSVMSEIRRVIIRGEERVVQAEKNLVHGVGEALEHTGQRLTGKGRVHDQAGHMEPAVPPAVREVVPKPAADMPGRLLTHDFSQTGHAFQADFTTDHPIPMPNIFFIADPARWVVDIPGTWRNMARFNNTIRDSFIARVVLGEHEGYLRIVFHFTQTWQSQPGTSPQIVRDANGFSVIVPNPEY